MTHKILLLGNISSVAENLFIKAGYEVEKISDPANLEKVSEALSSVSAVCGRTSMRLTKEMIERANNLRAVAVFSVNTSGVDTYAAARNGISVFNASGLNAPSVVELTFGLIFSVLRKIPQQNARLRNGVWQKSAQKDNAQEVRGKTLGILGMGCIGAKVAAIATAFGMKVIFSDPFVENSPDTTFRKVSTDELLKLSDIITVHAGATKELIGEDELRKMRNGSFLINMARSYTVNAQDVVEALKRGKLAGVGIDVHDIERDPFESVLLDPEIRDRVVITNHSGGETKEARLRISKETAQKVIDCLQTSKERKPVAA